MSQPVVTVWIMSLLQNMATGNKNAEASVLSIFDD